MRKNIIIPVKYGYTPPKKIVANYVKKGKSGRVEGVVGGVSRILEDNTTRILEDGTTRILE